MALLRTREATMRLFRPELRKHGLTEQQWRILRALADSGPMQVTALAGATFLQVPNLSRILRDLEKRRLIVRRQVATDLRRSLVSLDPRGLRLIAAHGSCFEKIYAQVAREFGTARARQLLMLLQEFEALLAGTFRDAE